MGQKVGTSLFYDEHKKCGKCGMTEKKAGCCKDEIKFYKLSNAHKHPGFFSGIEKSFLVARFASIDFITNKEIYFQHTSNYPSFSPDFPPIRLHLIYCTFLI
jgi:hypothetical protein